MVPAGALRHRWLSLLQPPGALRTSRQVAEPVEATGNRKGTGPFDKLRDLGAKVAEPVEATGTRGPFDELRDLGTTVAEPVEATGTRAMRPALQQAQGPRNHGG
ncbi:hypothetical protein QE406_001939 [Microbacterium testaceum]|nr:hypothetical protein [Microbacterium sp. SORGH_AS_0969]MDQ1115930.1 hypothetical protein [Microbacterium testaceum]